MSLLVCSLCKDEMGRYLTKVVPIWQQFADEILVVDDGSTDGSLEYLKENSCTVVRNDGPPMFGAERHIRELLFTEAIKTNHDWLLWLDTDMIPSSDPRPFTERAMNSLAFRYCDLWNSSQYREDEHWNAHLRPRVWAIKNDVRGNPRLADRGWHSGHIPRAAVKSLVGVVPERCSLLHYAYATEEGRQRQYHKYLKLHQEGHVTGLEWDHARTIIDPHPNLVDIPFDLEYSVEP